MYDFRKLRALLLALLVTQPSRRQLVFRWLWVVLGYAAAIGFALAQAFTTPHDWPISWNDIARHDVVARSFLLSSYVALATGFYMVVAIKAGVDTVSMRTERSPSEVARTMRDAARARDPHVAPVSQVDLPTVGAASEDTGSISGRMLVLATPAPLTGSLSLVLVGIVLSGLSLLFGALFASTIPQSFVTGAYYDAEYAPNASDVYTTVRFIGIFVMLSALALMFAWRSWNRWRAKGRGATVITNTEGLTIRGPATRWRERFIPWRRVESLAQFTYRDAYTHTPTVYMLDAGNQTVLWESPPDTPYAASSLRAKVAEQQSNAAQLLAIISAATSLPLLDLTESVNTMEKSGWGNLAARASGSAKSSPLATAGAGSGKFTITLKKGESRLEKWRRVLISLLGLIAIVAVMIWLSGAMGG